MSESKFLPAGNNTQRKITCPKCNKIQPPSASCKYCGVIFSKVKKQPPPVRQSLPVQQAQPVQQKIEKYLYKCEEIRQDSFFHGKLTAKRLEGVINIKADDGWVLNNILKTETRKWFFWKKQVVIAVFRMER